MSSVNHLVDLVFDNLIFRKVYHILGGLLVTGMIIVVDNGYLLFLLGLLYLVAFWVFGRRISFAVAGVLLLAVVTGSRFACAGAFLILTIGDGAAAIIGERVGGLTWPWHYHKTIAGTLAFFMSSLAALVLYIPFATSASSREIFWLALLPAATGAMVECMPIRIIRDRKPDDNLLIILSTGLLLHIMALALSVPISI